jgi:hypothetical protein
MERNPIPFALLKDEDTGRYEKGHAIKRLDCALYNECLDTAIAGKWKAFGCRECSAYELLDPEQATQDVLGLLAARMAAGNVAAMGNAGRTRGVKPGADAKVPKRKRRKRTG